MQVLKAQSTDDLLKVKILLIEYFDYLTDKVEHQAFDKELDNFAEIYLQEENSLLIAKSNENLVGCVGLQHINTEYCELKRMFVTPDYRNKGIGKLLLDNAIKEANSKSYKKVLLATPYNFNVAINMYFKKGFKYTTSYRKAYHSKPIFMELDI